jgi:ribonucleoside-diphosphate reductase beta chain
MSSLLDLTVQGDGATVSDESTLPRVKLMSPLELYRLWERQNWASHQIDLERDRRDWESMPERLRRELLFGLSGFFVGEERVTSHFSGLVLAAADKHEEAFLLTQQVDEARHAQHFNRLYEEVFAFDGSFEDRLGQARATLSADYRTLFDGHLVDAHAALLRDPGDLEAKIAFVTVYHMVIEGTLALTGQHFQSENLERLGVLPGHQQAFGLIAKDEHRHVAYGTWFLHQHAGDPVLAAQVRETLARTLPAASGALLPSASRHRGNDAARARADREINEFAFSALSRRLKVIGIGLPAVAR